MDILVAIVAIAGAHAAVFLPGMRGREVAATVFALVAVAVLAADAAPAVVHYHFILAGRLIVEPGQKLLASPFFSIGHVPVAVGEDEGRAVLRYHVLDLRQEMLVDIAVRDPDCQSG